MREYHALCLGTFSPDMAVYIKNLIYEHGGKSRTVNLWMRGRSPKKGFYPYPYQHSLPKKYANKFALYVRARHKVISEQALARKVNIIHDSPATEPIPYDVKEMSRIIRQLKRKGYSKSKIYKLLGGKEKA
jgi:SOS response regulatory protein OraA/RecX